MKMQELAIRDIYKTLRVVYTSDEAVGRMLLAGLDGELVTKIAREIN